MTEREVRSDRIVLKAKDYVLKPRFYLTSCKQSVACFSIFVPRHLLSKELTLF